MQFLKNVFIILLAIAVAIHSQQLHAMEQAMTAMLEGKAASDFQIYQLLSAATQDNPDCYIPVEVTHIIAKDACEITEKSRAACYETYGECLRSPDSILNFIKVNKSIHHMIIVDILKTCLSYSGKSLNTIKHWLYGHTVLHSLNFSDQYQQFRQDYVKIICLVAGDRAWNLITERDDNGSTVLHYCWEPYISELLNLAPSPQDAWWLINTRNNDGQTALGLAKQYKKDIEELLESYRPKEGGTQ